MRADLQISLGKTRSVSTCLNGLITSHFSAKEPHGAMRGVVGFQSKLAGKICEKMIVKKCSQTCTRLRSSIIGRKCGTMFTNIRPHLHLLLRRICHISSMKPQAAFYVWTLKEGAYFKWGGLSIAQCRLSCTYCFDSISLFPLKNG